MTSAEPSCTTVFIVWRASPQIMQRISSRLRRRAAMRPQRAQFLFCSFYVKFILFFYARKYVVNYAKKFHFTSKIDLHVHHCVCFCRIWRSILCNYNTEPIKLYDTLKKKKEKDSLRRHYVRPYGVWPVKIYAFPIPISRLAIHSSPGSCPCGHWVRSVKGMRVLSFPNCLSIVWKAWERGQLD